MAGKPPNGLWKLLLGTILALLPSSRGWATTLTVPDDAPSIQAAINAFPDTVVVRPGTYPESPLLTLSVVMIGEVDRAGGMPEIDACTILPPASTGSDAFSLKGFRIKGPILINNSEAYCRILFSQCDITAGITDTSYWLSTANITLSHCLVAGQADLRAHWAEVDSCQVSGSVSATGNFGSLVVRGSRFHGDGTGYAIGTEYQQDGIAIEDNTIANYGLALGAGVDSGAWVSGNLIEDCWYEGIYLQLHGITITNNVIRRCGVGLDLASANVLNVESNTITNCTKGGAILYYFGADGQVTGNVVSGCGGDGIYVYGQAVESLICRSNTLAANSGSGFVWGIDYVYVGGTVLNRNIGFANGGYGCNVLYDNLTTAGCNDWFGNVLGPMAGRDVAAGDLLLDPMFCDAQKGDYSSCRRHRSQTRTRVV